LGGKHERHARSKWEWGSPSSRSAELTEVVTDQVADFDKTPQAPGRKDRRARCKAAHGGPHALAVIYVAAHHFGQDGCRWGPGWNRRTRAWDGSSWRCGHEEHCSACGKVFRTSVDLEECPDYPGDPAQRADAEAEAVRVQERQAPWRWRRKPPVTGPQGYRRPRAAKTR
jgi:hypothetical protein